MASQRSVVFSSPVRTAIGTFGGSLKEVPAPDLGAGVIRGAVARAGLRPDEVGTVVMGNVVQAGAKMNPGAAGRDPCRAAGDGAGDDRQPGLRLGRAGDRLGRAGDHARQRRCRGRRRHGEHGPGAVSDRARPLGLSHGRRPALRQHAARRPERRVFGRSIRAGTPKIWSRNSRSPARRRTAGRCARSSVSPPPRPPASSRTRSSPVEVPGKQGPDACSTRTSTTGPDTTLEALARTEAGLSPGRHDHRRQCARPEQRRRGHGAGRRGLGGKARPRADGAARRLWHRRGRAGHVRPRPDSGGEAGAGARRLETSATSSASRSTKPSPPSRIAVARELGPARGYRQCRRRRDRPRPSDRRDGRGADDAPHPLDAPRRSQARHRHLCIGGGQGIALAIEAIR